MKTRASILFLFRKKSRLQESEKGPTTPGVIACRVTVRGKDAVISTGIKAAYGEWDCSASRLRGRSEAAKLANEQLVKMRDRITDIAADLDRQSKPITAKRLATLYKLDGCAVSLLELFGQFIEEQQPLGGVEISAATVTAHRVRCGNLQKFLEAHGLKDMRPEEFTVNMADKVLHWLMSQRGHGRNTALKNLQNISQVLTWGVRRELLDKNPMAFYKYKLAEPKEIIFLTAEEVGYLAAMPLASAQLRRVRDGFILQCWTGLAYADLFALDVAKAVESGPNGRRVLRVRRQKSTIGHGYECVIPLLPEAERILAEYSDKVPVCVNQLYNKCLKQIGEFAGIDPIKMTSHVGRKTAGTLMLNKGIPLAVVSKFLGHSNTKITEKLYAKLLDTTVMDAFDSVFGGPVPRPSIIALAKEAEGGRVVQLFRPARRIA